MKDRIIRITVNGLISFACVTGLILIFNNLGLSMPVIMDSVVGILCLGAVTCIGNVISEVKEMAVEQTAETA